MKQTQSFISTYTADVSGVCSALFELGGMTVMHDASGCNSTYTTHDEPRWYDQDSMVYISGLSEIEAIMGDDEKLINDIIDAAEQLNPRFIAIAGTPIPMMTGCDLPAIAADIESRTGIPGFGFQTNGMHSYIEGAGSALAEYALRMTAMTDEVIPSSVNILGATPLDFSVNGSLDSLRLKLEEAGLKVIGSWAFGSAPEELENAGRAAVNLVVSSVGLKAAEALKRRFGTPYVTGTPFGNVFGRKVTDIVKFTEKSGICTNVFDDYEADPDSDLVIIGESVMSRSLAYAIREEYGMMARVICPLETPEGILSPGDSAIYAEEDIADSIRSAKAVIADPLYGPLIPEGCRLFRLPHEAFSGRLFRKEIPDLIKSI